MWLRILCVAVVGAWSAASGAQTLKRLDQVSNVRRLDQASNVRANPKVVSPEQSLPVRPLVQAPQFQSVQPPPSTGRVQPAPAQVVGPGMKTGLDDIYGAKLCQVVSADPTALMACVNEVSTQMRDLNPFQTALRVCNRRSGMASVMTVDRSSPCFGLASSMIQDPAFKVRANQCRTAGIMGPQAGECLRNLFARENAKESTKGATRAPASGATSFKAMQR